MNILTYLKANHSIQCRDFAFALASVVIILAVYYIAVYTIGYPFSYEPVTDYRYYEVMVKRSLGEEAVFRLLPLMLVIHVFGAKWRILLPIIIALSIWFALGHNGLRSILAIAPAGVVLSVAFLVFGGLNKNYLRGFLWAGGIHVSANICILFVVPLIFF